MITIQETKIPLALINLKEGAGENWSLIRKSIRNFFDIKRELKYSNLPEKTKKNLELMAYKEYFHNNIVSLGQFLCLSSPMNKEQIISHYKNVICALHRMEYDSKVMCFIIDGYNTKEHFHIKYPQFR